MTKKQDEYISIIGHEFRTPLSSIRGYLSMILEGDMGEISDEARKALNHCYDSSVRLTKLVNDILNLSKIEAGKMEYFEEEINIINFLESVYKDVFIEIEDKLLNLNIQVDKNLKNKKILVDKNKLKQVFLNLVGNAVKFTETGGNIKIKASREKNKVLFEIIDNGIGIPKDKIKKLFKKFSQIEGDLQRNNKHGLGLGLALCDKFIKDFGSKVKVKSEVGKGSSFSFKINLIKN